MKIPKERRLDDAAQLRRWLAAQQVDQLHLWAPDDVEGHGWVRYARCGPEQSVQLDPGIFHQLTADSEATYLAQQLCLTCPVREWCDRAGEAGRYPGVWGGVFRRDDGLPAPLCSNDGCFRFRSINGRKCRRCLSREREARRPARPAVKKELVTA